MKRILLILLTSLIISLPVFAFSNGSEIITNKELVKRRQKIQEIGYKLLNANVIDKRITFVYAHSKNKPDAFISHKNREIQIYKGLMDLIDDDDELAFIIAREISYGIDFYKGPLKGFFYFPIWPPRERRIENRADLRAVDFMTKAGYNPVASIVISNKILAQSRYEWYSYHSLGSKRMARLYAHIYQKYPYFLVNNVYQENLIYQNFLLTSRENRLIFKKTLDEFEKTNKIKKPKYK